MAYILNGTTIKSPNDFTRSYVETAGTHTTVNGRTVKDLMNRKEQFVLDYTNISRTDLNTILAIYNLETTVDFQVTETNLTVQATPVHVDINQRGYIKGGDYREKFTLILTEVD